MIPAGGLDLGCAVAQERAVDPNGSANDRVAGRLEEWGACWPAGTGMPAAHAPGVRRRRLERPPNERDVVLGVELELYTVVWPGGAVRPSWCGTVAAIDGNLVRFTRDRSIGTEDDSPPFATIRRGTELLHAALRRLPARCSGTNGQRTVALLGS